MELTRKQFDLLEALAIAQAPLTQRDLEKATGHSLGTISRTMKELTELSFISNGSITDSGVDAL